MSQTDNAPRFDIRRYFILLSLVVVLSVLLVVYLVQRQAVQSDYDTVIYPLLLWSRRLRYVLGFLIVPFVYLMAQTKTPFGIPQAPISRIIATILMFVGLPLACGVGMLMPTRSSFVERDSVTVGNITYHLVQHGRRACLSDGTSCFQARVFACEGGLTCQQVSVLEPHNIASYTQLDAFDLSLVYDETANRIDIIENEDIIGTVTP